MNPTHVAVDGYVDALPTPGVRSGTASFDLIRSPDAADRNGPDTPDTVYACATGDPRITDMLLREIQPGDLLRVTGTLVQSATPDATAWLTVDALEVLEAGPDHVLFDLVIERFGSYLVAFDADRDVVPVFTVSGTWVGEAASPDVLSDLIDALETATRDDEHSVHRPAAVPRRPPPRLLARRRLRSCPSRPRHRHPGSRGPRQ